MDPHAAHRELLAPYRAALAGGDISAARAELHAISLPDADFRMAHPLPAQSGATAHVEAALAPLAAAWPDFERRDWIVMAGTDAEGADWVGCGGHYVGTFNAPWLDIPPTGHLVHMRYHEFYRIADGRVVEMQALWDLPEVMMQAGAWPMAPSLGREMRVPGPAPADGLRAGARDAKDSAATVALVENMLAHMVRHPAEGGPEVMDLARFWHPRMTWYGPAGIGTARGIAGFRNWHQIPFLAAMPDRGRTRAGTTSHFFGDGPYAAVTGWPNMVQTLTGDGWLGLAPAGQTLRLKSLDFWRVEDGLIRENWVLVDLLDMYAQLGVDVLARMREVNKARVGFDPETGRAAA